jgi:hypothetical protein
MNEERDFAPFTFVIQFDLFLINWKLFQQLNSQGNKFMVSRLNKKKEIQISKKIELNRWTWSQSL